MPLFSAKFEIDVYKRQDHPVPRFSGSRSRIAAAIAGQDPNSSSLGLYKARALASSVSIERQGRAEHAEGRSRAVA